MKKLIVLLLAAAMIFIFQDNHTSYPVITDIQAAGFIPLEGNTYVNNSISG